MQLAVFVVHLLKFSLVGTGGFLVDAATLTILTAVGLDLYRGRVASFLIAATFTWYCNRRFTFRDRPGTGAVVAGRSKQWATFIAANSLGAALNYGTYAGLIALHSTFARHPVLAVAAGSLAGLACNFTLSRALVFRAADGRG